MKIEEGILKILSNCEIKGNIVFLPKAQLARMTYHTVNKHLENLGGKWSMKEKGHVFASDPSDKFENMLLTGETTDFKKEFQFFQTPPELARKMVKMADLKPCDLVLEPSAGMGVIAREIYSSSKECKLICNELNPEMASALFDVGFTVSCTNFLKILKDGLGKNEYSKIIMNPPFTRQQDIDHIYHAYSLLPKGGILVSVVSESPFFRDNLKSVRFREWLEMVDAEIIINMEGTFKASGTMVKTRLVKIIKGC